MLTVAALIPTLWLTLTNQLILYIHPRYVVFTAIMAVIGLVFVIASFAAKHDERDHAEHDRADHVHADAEPAEADHRMRRTIGTAVGGALTLLVGIALVVVPPATLTTATADQRVINSTSVGSTPSGSGGASTLVASGASSKFSVSDWAALLRQSSDANFYRNKGADVTGFVTADRTDPDNMFFVSRFVITCCAVDAQPVGVPVYLPNWKNTLKANEWVRVKGVFGTNPSTASTESIALTPSSTTKVSQPSDPYLY
ncbi:hypothetical protein BH09ACT1_BH09ACT1_08710 [soil metagenome]